jgi:endogenous inhibitor of DNA gyrase (YacG/DUF329 family)
MPLDRMSLIPVSLKGVSNFMEHIKGIRIERNCKICGKKFNTYLLRIEIGRGKYCSKKCFFKSKANKTLYGNCVICNKRMHINPSQPRQCCSYKCRSVLKTKKIKVNCPICGKGFYGLPKEIEKGHDKYCSAKCNGVGLMRGKILNCTICGKPYYRSLSRIRKGNGSKCCSMKCLSIYALTKTKRINTSIEIAMEKILIKNNVSYIKQFPIENIAVVDFLLPGKIIIQCDGDYWHNLPGK